MERERAFTIHSNFQIIMNLLLRLALRAVDLGKKQIGLEDNNAGRDPCLVLDSVHDVSHALQDQTYST